MNAKTKITEGTFRHFFGVAAKEDGEFKIRALTTYTKFRGGDTIQPGVAIEFSWASTPIVEGWRRFDYSRIVGNSIAVGRYAAGKTEVVVSKAESLNDTDNLPSSLMIARVCEINPSFGSYTWLKGPVSAQRSVVFKGFQIHDRIAPVMIIKNCGSPFIVGADSPSVEKSVESRERLKAMRLADGKSWTEQTSVEHVISL